MMRDIDKQLLLASLYGHSNKIKRLVSNGANVHVECDHDLHCSITRGHTPLVCAAGHGKIKALNVLYELGADVHKNNNLRYSSHPLIPAVFWAQKDAILWLLGKGVDINLSNFNLSSPLMIACERNSPEMYPIIKLLIEHGANMNQQDKLGYTSPMIFLNNQNFNKDVFQFMIEQGIDETLERKVNIKEDTLFKQAKRKGFNDEMLEWMTQLILTAKEKKILLQALSEPNMESIQLDMLF